MTAPPDHPPIRCVLELRYDGTLVITRLPGCTLSDVHDILRLLTQTAGPFDYLTILPESDEQTAQGMSQPPHPTPPASPARYPTTADIVHAAVTAKATYINGAPSQFSPNYSLPCTDLEGGEHQLIVVPLGGRVALVAPEGATAVLRDVAVSALAGSLEDAAFIKIPGGDMRVGEVMVMARTDITLVQEALLYITARPYEPTASIDVETAGVRMSWNAGPDTLRQLAQICTRAERVLLGHTDQADDEPAATESTDD